MTDSMSRSLTLVPRLSVDQIYLHRVLPSPVRLKFALVRRLFGPKVRAKQSFFRVSFRV